ncbi:MAG: transglycosylase family protein [Acidimicrobiales bacterium]
MRNHRLFGVVIAVLLGTSFLHKPSAPQLHHHQHHNQNNQNNQQNQNSPVAGSRLGGARIELASSTSSALARMAPDAPIPAGEVSRSDVLNPARARYMEAVWSWVTTVAANTPPPPAPTVVPVPKVAPTPKAAPAPKPAPAPKVVTAPVAPATSAASGGVWASLRRCESGGNYADNTGNGYYGAYQFSLATWRGLGFTGLPSAAAPAVQDRAAQELQARSGWGQWPSCSRQLRLT